MGTAESEFRFNANIHLEAVFELPDAASDLRKLAEGWFENALGELASTDLDPFAASLDLTGRSNVLRKSGIPFGEPGELWGSFGVTRHTPKGRKVSSSVWSPRGWQKFLKSVEEVPLAADVRLCRLGADGYPGSPWIDLSMRRQYDAPEWVTLAVDGSSQEFAAPETSLAAQTRWRNFLQRRLEGAESDGRTCLYGCIADDIEVATGRSAFEVALGVFPYETVPTLNHELRGYSWVTVCSPGVALRLGGQEGAEDAGAFSAVTPLSGGGLLLQATEDMRAYGPERVRAVYDALRPVLPAGEALSFITNQDIRLVFQG
ncbi:hypothetical protein PUR34_19875 [Streptomyces sp. JV185]|uniref:hypothetical protein n=1 Tax=Streptomyces sp. JV185 TaxID=858638 RepID=UPI002E7764F6|nr:hypothetical protein [Streptomyces sp. JV185]MEE1770331.1 hypothetical protein [Streptomyces sp. JV185]